MNQQQLTRVNNINILIDSQKKEFNLYYYNLLKSCLSKDLLSEAMIYGSMNGGKRIRPFLVSIFSKIAKIKKKDYLRISSAVESIHSYSLIHDDLPSMDDDDYRRGKLSTHKKFTEAIAILAGDALHDLAFEILSDKKMNAKPDIKISIINNLSKKLGFKGLAGGQSLDLFYENKKIDIKKILNMYEMKTSALFSFSCVSPYILANKSIKELNFAENYGNILGLIFQITDDILDLEKDFKLLGKTPGKDKKQGKSTPISLSNKKKLTNFCKLEINKFEKKFDKYLKKDRILKDILYYIYERIN